ncbi:MAG TPA: DUF167 domain-containing protein [Pseudomonadales bacterium]|nr:DUF167 domain-containing protein [Pseudomonadales bacterium]
MSLPAFLHAQPDGVLLSIKIQPRAAKNHIAGAHGNELKIQVTAPPVDSAANEALVELLAVILGCGRNRIEIIRGHKSRHKTVKLHGFAPEEILQKFYENG